MKKTILAAAVLLVALSLGACHKTCSCIAYDGSRHAYTSDEVAANGGSCYEMRNYPLPNYYSVCNWE